MRKRAFGIVAATAFSIAVAGAPVAADPNPDSAAGTCVGGDKFGLGQVHGKVFVPTLKEGAEEAGLSLGQFKQFIELPPGYGVPEHCAPKKGQQS